MTARNLYRGTYVPRSPGNCIPAGRLIFVAVVFLLVMAFASPRLTASDSLAFAARSVTGSDVSISAADETAKLYVVCFLGAECPMARIYGPRLSALAAEYADDGVRFIGVNSNRQDSYGDVRKYVEDLNIGFLFIHDRGNVIADQFDAHRTPEVFVLDNDLKVRYRGRIDDQYEPGVSRSVAKRQDLRVAIDELIAAKPVSVPATKAVGCIIGRVTDHAALTPVQNEITYSRDVVPVLRRNCLECHRNGEIGPFAMDSYGEVAGWADTMMETIDNGRMPPWHANPDYGSFVNARHMSTADKAVIRYWIAGGLKEGQTTDLPPSVADVVGWQLSREPDLVVEMRDRPFVVPSNGVVEYQYFVADPCFHEDKWITAAQVMPGSRSVVHHAIVFVRPPDGAKFRGVGWLSAYVPGQRMVALPPGCARKIPAGSKLVFQMHYTPNGEVAEDVTKIGLLFGNEPDVTHEAITLIAINQEFEIPPKANSHVVSARVSSWPDQGELLAATPHMHYRGKAFRLFGSADDSEVLLDVPNYDFNWQHSYVFSEPIPLSNLRELRFEAAFDNSSSNPFNPDPNEWVTWGDQTWEEMAIAFFEVSEPRKSPPPTSSGSQSNPEVVDSQRQKKIDAYVARAFGKMDANGDGRITQNEAPIVVRRFNFGQFDLDGDNVATKEEIREVAERLY